MTIEQKINSMIYSFDNLKEHGYIIIDEGTIISHEMWAELLNNKEARKIIDKHIKH